jgi:hypothetical protein
MEHRTLIGIGIQTLIWICIFYINYLSNHITDYPNYFVLVILSIALFIYFFEFMWNSKMNLILSQKRRQVSSKHDLIKYLTLSKPYLEVSSKAYHYYNDKPVLTYEKVQLFDFDDIKDQTIVKYINFYSDEISLKDKLIALDINLFMRFIDQSCHDELDSEIQKIKNDVSFKDKYYECKTKFIFRFLEEHNNIFTLNECSFWCLSRFWMVFFYLLLIGEFYKIYFNSCVYYTCVELVKQVGRSHSNKRLGNFIAFEAFYLQEDDLLFNDTSKRKWSNGSIHATDAGFVKESTPLIDNYDPLFDASPMMSVKGLDDVPDQIAKGGLHISTPDNNYLSFSEKKSPRDGKSSKLTYIL